mmetsp:Transcript_6151/g.11741  ORF Transcript_6151/g.11741 Transcript_6151/m.11741 type:complete len:329 (-) Transcript_6151:1102-2088(-)
MSTIDILDECLSISYQVRKSSIRARKHKPKGQSTTSDKHMFKMDDKVVPKGRYIPPKHYAEIIETLPKKRYRVRWVHDEMIEIFEAHMLKPWIEGKKDYFEDEDEEPPPNVNNMESPNRKVIQRQPSLNGKKMTVEFATVESQQDDLEAQKTFDAFKNELNEWWIDNALRREDEDLRGEVADSLTERYMCHKMDPLPASRTVTHIRKTMAQILENFACDGELPPDITGEIVVKSKKKPITAYDIMKAKEDAEKQAENSYQRKREEARAKETGKDRENNERKKIKDQYENYMRLKSKALDHEDNAKEKEIESHLDDIKSLISTFHSPES